MKKNLEKWNKLATPPKDALKKITFGSLKGKSSIDPTWRLMAMTEVYGPVAQGWMYKITNISYQPVLDQIMVIVEVSVHVATDKDSCEWSRGIPGVGTAMFLDKNKQGLRVDDDSIKKALSDALSVAFKAFGVGADVYMGMMDGDKYQPRPSQGPPPEPKKAPVKENVTPAQPEPAQAFRMPPDEQEQQGPNPSEVKLQELCEKLEEFDDYNKCSEWVKNPVQITYFKSELNDTDLAKFSKLCGLRLAALKPPEAPA